MKNFLIGVVGLLWICGFEVCYANEATNLLTAAMAALEHGDNDLAIDYCTKMIQLNIPDSYLGRGKAYYQKHDYPKAIADFNECILRRPSAIAFSFRGDAYLKIGDYDKSTADYTEAIILNPNNGMLYVERAGAYDLNHQRTPAIIDCSTAIMLLENLSASNVLARAYALRGQMYSLMMDNKCFSDFDKAIALDPQNSQFRLYRGDAFSFREEYPKAMEDYNEAIRLNPTNAVTYANRGLIYDCNGFGSLGVENCNRAIQLDQSCALAYEHLAWILAVGPDSTIRDGKKALDSAKRSCDLTEWKNPQCIDTLAASYAAVGDFENALKWQQKSLEFDRSENDQRALQIRVSLYKQRKAFHAKGISP